MRDVGQQSLFDCERPLVTAFDEASKLQHSKWGLMTLTAAGQVARPIVPFDCSSLDEYVEIKISEIAWSLVEVRGVEPLTPWLQTMCSAN